MIASCKFELFMPVYPLRVIVDGSLCRRAPSSSGEIRNASSRPWQLVDYLLFLVEGEPDHLRAFRPMLREDGAVRRTAVNRCPLHQQQRCPRLAGGQADRNGHYAAQGCRSRRIRVWSALGHDFALSNDATAPRKRMVARAVPYDGFRAIKLANAIKPKNSPFSARRRASPFIASESRRSMRPDAARKSAPRSTTVSI